MNPLIQIKTAILLLLIVLTLVRFGPCPEALATDLGSVLPNGNTADGSGVLISLTTGSNNSGFGFEALLSNTMGDGNTAVGSSALFINTTGSFNTASGSGALASNTMGTANTATGQGALSSNTTGGGNTANGFGALQDNTTGSFNTAIGYDALFGKTTGNNNIALGFNAGFHLTAGSDNIYIGNPGVNTESNTIRIGNSFSRLGPVQTVTYIAGISGTPLIGGVAVRVNAQGQLGTAPSSARFKDDIKPMDKTSEAILGLKPVTFRYKKEIDPEGSAQFGLIAEDVAKVNPDLIVRDASGEIYTVRYEAVNAMLLNEFLKEHRTVQNQQKEIDVLKAELKEQKALIQKVNAQLEMSKAAPRVAENIP
jgi:trimeric autotransporter adhesin